MNISVRQAAIEDVATVVGILSEAAAWLEERGIPLWCTDELSVESILASVQQREFFLAERDGEAAGVVKFQSQDTLFWPDAVPDEAAYLHRLAVQRRFAGGEISSTLLSWAAERARQQGRQFLRLDTDAARPQLRAIYERFGFRHHSDRQVGPYFVARYELPL